MILTLRLRLRTVIEQQVTLNSTSIANGQTKNTRETKRNSWLY
jgi:hypothetical protein